MNLLMRYWLIFMKTPKFNYHVCDFETVIFDGQKYTEVWAAAGVAFYTEDVKIWNNIDDFLKYYFNLKGNHVIFFHNLKFDGSFILDWLLKNPKFSQAVESEGTSIKDVRFRKRREMKNNTFSYVISNLGQWYKILVKVRNKIIEFRDSVKLLPFSVEEIGEAFNTKYRKTSIEYKGLRHAGGEISDLERDYIKNDVLVAKEALETLFSQGHDRLTIGSCCMKEFKSGFSKSDYRQLFPDLYSTPSIFGESKGDFVRLSYRGAWTYLVPGKAHRVLKNGFTVDANSLYPSVMHSESGNRYPVGEGVEWMGDIPDVAKEGDKFYFVKLKTRFYLKEGKLPFMQIKGNLLYPPLEMLKSSDVRGTDGRYCRSYEKDGEVVDAIPELVLTQMDFELLKEHYYLEDLEIIGGIWFHSEIGLFDGYIDKFRRIKENSVGAMRTLAKLFLNNLYGKMAASTDSSFKYCVIDEGRVKLIPVHAKEKEGGYIPCGSAIISYGRCTTIRAAQANYYGDDKKGFIYADTDSLHCDLDVEGLRGVKLDKKKFQCWKVESEWDEGYFVRSKRYIEVSDGDILITCAGMPKRCKKLFESSLTGVKPDIPNMSDDERRFISQKRCLSDFDEGLQVPGKLVFKRIPGGAILSETSFEMR